MIRDYADIDEIARSWPLLDLLQDGAAVVQADGEVPRCNAAFRQMIGRRSLRTRRVQELLVETCRSGEAVPGLWDEIQLVDDTGGSITVARLVVRLKGADAESWLLLLRDQTAEAAVHEKYRRSLEEERSAKRNLELEIAHRIRAHEDDLAQAIELIQLAPEIFETFVTECRERMGESEDVCAKGEALTAGDVELLFRHMHAIKGAARSFGLNRIAERSHAVEEVLEGGLAAGLSAAALPATIGLLSGLRLAVERADAFYEKLSTALDSSAGGGRALLPARLVNDLAELERDLRSLAATLPATAASAALALASRTARWVSYDVQGLLERLRRSLQELAFRRHLEIECQVSCDVEQTLPKSLCAIVDLAMTQLGTNAVVHGSETAEERISLGKPRALQLRLGVGGDSGTVVLTVEDDGAGLQAEKVRARIVELGWVPQAEADKLTHADLCAYLARPGLSTAGTVDLHAGRGVGLDTVATTVREAGGKLSITARPQQGMSVTIELPRG